MYTSLYDSEICESRDDSRDTHQKVYGRLAQRTASVKPGTEQLDSNAAIVIHALKSSLATIITASNAIFDITDLTPEELSEYLHQIRSNAYRMDAIINGALLQPEVGRRS